MSSSEITYSPTCMNSVNRLVKLPVVESTLQTATNIYGKVKDINGVTHWTCTKAEGAYSLAVEAGKPFVQTFETPIKKVDSALCTGLDYVESKVPAVKLPPSEIYISTKEYVQPKVEYAVEKVKQVVEPIVEPAIEYGVNKVEEYLHRRNSSIPKDETHDEQPNTNEDTHENQPQEEHKEEHEEEHKEEHEEEHKEEPQQHNDGNNGEEAHHGE